ERAVGLFVTSELPQQQAHADVGVRVRGIESDRLLVLLDGLRVLPLPLEIHRLVVMQYRGLNHRAALSARLASGAGRPEGTRGMKTRLAPETCALDHKSGLPGRGKALDRRMGVRTTCSPLPTRFGSGAVTRLRRCDCAPPPPTWGGDRGGGSMKEG